MLRTLSGLVLAAILVSGGLLHAFQSPTTAGPQTSLDQGLRGSVKSVRVEESSADGSPRKFVERSLFDRGGRVLEYAHLFRASPTRTAYQVFRYIYDSKSRIHEEDMFDASSLQKSAKHANLQRHIYKYDSQGRCIEEHNIDSDGESSGSTTYTYDNQGDSIRETDYSSAGKVESIEDREYAPDHRLLFEKTRENRSGQGSSFDYQWSREHRYDAQGNHTNMLSYQQGVLEARWVWTYDERRRLISSQVIVSDPAKDQHTYGFCGDCGLSAGRTIYTYDSNGRITEERVLQPGDKLVGLERYSYDAHGNRTREWVYQFGSTDASQQKTAVKLDGAEQLATWTNGLPTNTFSYDSHGNWIKKITITQTGATAAEARITSLTYRQIEYY